jgi:hypothetical protein
VIGQGDGIETALFRAMQNIEDSDAWLLVVRRRRGVDVEVDATPGVILRNGCLSDIGAPRCWRPGRSRLGWGNYGGFRLRRRGSAFAAPACGRNGLSPSGAGRPNVVTR